MNATPLITMKRISKSYPGVRALQNVSLELHEGEVLALLGENGAGKSTLIKILSGTQRPDSGEIRMRGERVAFTTPSQATQAGVAVIHQELNLVPDLTVWENIGLGREAGAWIVKRREERERALRLFEQLGVSIPVDRPCGSLSIAQQQIVEIAKALAYEMRLIIMDEPSAAITPRETQQLFKLIRDLQSKGIAVVYISHRLEEIGQIAQRVMVLRDGSNVADASVDSVTREQLIGWMVGRKMSDEYPRRHHDIGAAKLAVNGLNRKGVVSDISFAVGSGEILGITGLVGAGRTELARLIFGADVADSGEISVAGKRVKLRQPRDAIAAGICLLTEDRKHQGLILEHSVTENFSLPNSDSLAKLGFRLPGKELVSLKHFVRSLRIKLPSSSHAVGTLSGGNQQKVVLAKWLQRNAEVVIFDEPTRGIDVGAKREIYQLINQLAQQGKAIILISSELPEVLGMSDRLLVMHEGSVRGEFENPAAVTQQQVMELALGKRKVGL